MEDIAKLRKKKDLTQKQLAEQLGVKRITVTQWEIGRRTPSIYMLKKICIVLQCDLNEITKNVPI